MEADQSQPQSDQPQGAGAAHPLDQRIVKVARVVMATKQQVEQLNDAVSGLASHQRHMDSLAADLKTRIGELSERLGSAGASGPGGGGMSADLEARLQKLDLDVSAALAGIDSTAERVELASSKIDEQVFALKNRVTGFADGVEEWFKPARSEIEANRAFVERASDQIRQKLQGFEKAAQDLQSCVEGGVADLQRRHETRDVNLSALAAKLDECLGRLTQNADHMGKAAVEHIRPLLDALTRHVSDTCVDEKKLNDHLRAVHLEIESLVARSEQRVTPLLSEFGTRLGASETITAEIRETCRALQNQIGGAVGQLEDRIVAMQQTVDNSVGVKFDEKLGRLRAQVAEMLASASDERRAADERVAAQVAALQEGIEAWGRRSEEDARHRTELSWEQKELGAAVGRLEEKIEAALETFGTHGDERAAAVARQLGELQAQINDAVAPVVATLQERDRESAAAAEVVSLGFKDVQRQLTAITQQLDERVARSLGEIHAQHLEVHEAAETQRRELTAGQKELSMAMLRLQGQVTDSITSLTEQQTRQGDQAGNLTGELNDLREQLANLGDQLGITTAEIDNRVTASLADAERSTREAVAGIRDELAQQVAEKLAELASAGTTTGAELAGVEKQLAALSAGMDDVSARLQEQGAAAGAVDPNLGPELADLKSTVETASKQLQEAVADLGRAPSREQEQLTAVERQLDDLREHMSTLGERLDSMTGELDKRMSKMLAASGDGSSGIPVQTAELERQLEELATSMKSLGAQIGEGLEPLATMPSHVEERITEAITQLNRTPSREQEQLTGVERQLDDLREHIAVLSDRMSGVTTTEMPDGTAGAAESAVRISASIEQGMATLRDKLEAVTDHVDTRVSEVTTAIGEVATRESDGDLARQLEEQLDALQEQLTSLGRRFGSVESSLAELEAVPPPVSAIDHRIEVADDDGGYDSETVTAPTTEPIGEPMDGPVADMVEAMPTTPDETDDFVDTTPEVDVEDIHEPAPPVYIVPSDDPAPMDDTTVAEDDEPEARRGLLTGRKLSMSEPPPAEPGLIDLAVPSDATGDSATRDEVVHVDEPTTFDEHAPATPVDSATTAEALPIEDLIDALIKVINSGDAAQMQKFIAEQYSQSALSEGDMDDRVATFMGIHEETGEMRVVNWEVGEEGEIIVVLQTRRSLDRMRFEIMRESQSPHKISKINIDRI